jgi:uncharacterized membrane protein YhhN
MKKSPGFLKNLFFVVAIIELSGHVFEIPEINQFSKPLLMPVLLVYFKRALKVPMNLSFLIGSFALIFSWGGDVFLMFEPTNSNFFIFGLGSFAIAQILYMITFSKARNETQHIEVQTKLPYTIPFVIFSFGFLWYMWPHIGELKVPVSVYSLLLLGIAVAAIYRMEETSLKSFNQVFFGAVLFILSDTLIAIDKFLTPMNYSGLFIMLTYILAQWNIVNGLLLHYNEKAEA